MNLTKNVALNDLVPSDFYLSQNYPNPFKEKTVIKYCLAYKTKVRVEVFNCEGKMIKKLLDEEKEAGTYEVEFQSAVGIRQLANGTFIYQLQAGDFLSTKKMMKMKTFEVSRADNSG